MNNFSFLFLSVPPVIVKKDKQVFKLALGHLKYDLTCTISKGRPAPVFTWEYQPWPCDFNSKHTTCKPIKDNWNPVPSNIGKANVSTAKTSVLGVSPSDEFAFFRCSTVNKVGKDNVVFALLTTGTWYTLLLPLSELYCNSY